MGEKQCKKCRETFPITRQYFGSTPSGGFRNTCRACMAARTREWAEDNADRVADRLEERRVREIEGGPRDYGKHELVSLRVELNNSCAYCGIPLGRGGHLDHKIPVALGGTNNLENMTYCCEQCNREKHAKTVHEYFHWRRERNLPTNGVLFDGMT